MGRPLNNRFLIRLFSYLVIFLLVEFANGEVAATETLKLQITEDGGKIIRTEEINLTKNSSGWNLETNASNNGLDGQYYQTSWEVIDKKVQNQFMARRQGNTIVLQGVFKGKSVKKEYKIDNHSWFQYPEISLHAFLRTGEQRQLFWIISLADLNIYQFEGVKQGQEQIKVIDKIIDCVRVRIQPTGLFGAFWHADYWFRLSDKSYMRYEARHGDPATPLTIKERLLNYESNGF